MRYPCCTRQQVPVDEPVLTYALECPVHFLSEQRSELYRRYCSGVAQLKNVLGAKNSFQGRTCFGLERCGA